MRDFKYIKIMFTQGVCIIPSDPRLEAAWLEGSEGPYGAGINIPLPEYGADNFRRTVAGLRRRAGRQFFDANGNHQFCGSCAGHLNYVTQKFCAFYIFNEEGGGWALSVLLDIVKLLKPDTPAHWNWKWGFHWVMVVDVYDFILHWEYELILVVYGSLCGFTCWLLYWLVYDRPQHKETTRLSWGRLLLRHCYQRRQPPAALRALQLQFQEARARREAEEAAATGSGNANNAPTGKRRGGCVCKSSVPVCFHALHRVTSCEGGYAAGEGTCKQRTAVFVRGWEGEPEPPCSHAKIERSQGRRRQY